MINPIGLTDKSRAVIALRGIHVDPNGGQTDHACVGNLKLHCAVTSGTNQRRAVRILGGSRPTWEPIDGDAVIVGTWPLPRASR